jgi:hypothetical protein
VDRRWPGWSLGGFVIVRSCYQCGLHRQSRRPAIAGPRELQPGQPRRPTRPSPAVDTGQRVQGTGRVNKTG